jgi:NAD(P)-dependent dehydrogenase (short-subunit alcohol dehydrogenase family)
MQELRVMYPDLRGKTALITGAAGGIGSAIAELFCDLGVRLFLADINQPVEGQPIPAEIGRMAFHVCDVSDPHQVEEMYAAFEKEFESLDILINVPFAFPSRVQPHQLAYEDWQKTWAVSVTGYFLCIQEALKRMIPRKSGCILNIGSIAGVSALGRGNFPYSCAKGAVHQMTKELAVEYARSGIRVNAILPAQVLTPGLARLLEDPRFADSIRSRTEAGIPIGRLLQPEEIAAPAAFLCSEAASAITGVLLPVDGGNLALNAGGSVLWPDE